jgi:hypothetical protein
MMKNPTELEKKLFESISKQNNNTQSLRSKLQKVPKVTRVTRF